MERPKRMPFPWLFRWKFWRVFLLVIASCATLLALFDAEEYGRGKRAWENFKEQMATKGITFDFAKYVPPPVPDDENFAMTPFFAPLFDFVPGTQRTRDTNAWQNIYAAIQLPHDLDDKVEWIKGGPLDLPKLANELEETNHVVPTRFLPGQSQEAARAILEKLQATAPIFDELRQAGKRPYSRFNIAYDWEDTFAIILPHLSAIKLLCFRLELHACAELTLGQPDPAAQDIELMFRLIDAVRTEPFLVSQLVRANCLNLALQPIWEGLSRHQWADPQLKAFAQNLQKLDFLEDADRGLRAEECYHDSFFTELRAARHPSRVLDRLSDVGIPISEDFETALVFLPARGWSYFEEVNYDRLRDEQFDGVIQANSIDPILADQREGAAMEELRPDGFMSALLSHRLIARELLPSLNGLERRMARDQDNAELGLMACALERYRLAKGQFPETLDALAPHFLEALPHDVIMGESFIYRRTDDGQFLLYSVGWNKKDDNGVPSLKNRDDSDGDWVWKYTVTAER